MKTKQTIAVAAIILVTLGVASSPFLFIFRTQDFSLKLNDWASAATWLSLFTSLATTLILAYISWRIHQNEAEYQNKHFNLLRSLEKPILTFYCEKDRRPANIDQWKLKNIGKGAALNITICHFESENKRWDETLIDCYSMGANESPLELSWLENIKCAALIAFYQDTLSKEFYCSIGLNDQTHYIDLNDEFSFTWNNDEILNKNIIQILLRQEHIRKQTIIERNKQEHKYTFL